MYADVILYLKYIYLVQQRIMAVNLRYLFFNVTVLSGDETTY